MVTRRVVLGAVASILVAAATDAIAGQNFGSAPAKKQTKNKPRKKWAWNIEVFRGDQKVGRRFKTLGPVHAEFEQVLGPNYVDGHTIETALQHQAAKLGADAIINVRRWKRTPKNWFWDPVVLGGDAIAVKYY